MAGLARKSRLNAVAGRGPVFPSNVPDLKTGAVPARAFTMMCRKLTADLPTIE